MTTNNATKCPIKVDMHEPSFPCAFWRRRRRAAYRLKHGDGTLILSAKIATRILTDMKLEADGAP